jgi:hypothetical protein
MQHGSSRRRASGGQGAADDAIGRYLAYMRVYADALTRKAEREARQHAATGEQQEISAFFHVRDDAQDTQARLERYVQRLRAARRAGRYAGGTTLRRVLPDGTTAPWMPGAGGVNG